MVARILNYHNCDFFFKVYFILRQRKWVQVGEGQIVGGRERIWNRHCTISAEPDVEFECMNHEIMTAKNQELDAQPTESPRLPQLYDFWKKIFIFERESTIGGGAKREREEDRGFEVGFVLCWQQWAQCRSLTHERMEPWERDLSRSRTPHHLSHPGAHSYEF